MSSAPTTYLRAAADLAWLLDSPPLYRLESPLPDWFWQRIIPPALPTTLARQLASDGNLRLGHYAELLMGWWMSAHPGIADFQQAVILRQQGLTLGELDFLIRGIDETEFHHLEISVKYFLGLGELNDPAAWIGLNPRDTLARKLIHMRTHQLRLGHDPTAATQLHAQGVRVKAASGLVMGILFYPLTALTHEGPEGVCTDHLRGWWCTQAALPCTHGERYLPLQRRYWLATQQLDDATALATPAALKEANIERPVMLSRQRQDSSGRWREYDRGVVVPDAWPPLAAVSPAAV